MLFLVRCFTSSLLTDVMNLKQRINCHLETLSFGHRLFPFEQIVSSGRYSDRRWWPSKSISFIDLISISARDWLRRRICYESRSRSFAGFSLRRVRCDKIHHELKGPLRLSVFFLFFLMMPWDLAKEHYDIIYHDPDHNQPVDDPWHKPNKFFWIHCFHNLVFPI